MRRWTWLLIAVPFSIVLCSCGQRPSHEPRLRTYTKWVGGKATRSDEIAEWMLRIPQNLNIIFSAYFRDDAVYDANKPGDLNPWLSGGGFKNGSSSFSIQAGITPEGRFVSSPSRLQTPKTDETFNMSLSNDVPGAARRAHGVDGYCITDDEMHPKQHEATKGCKMAPLCGIFMGYHGWAVTLFVETGGLYRSPQRACRLARAALETWTVHLDDLVARQ